MGNTLLNGNYLKKMFAFKNRGNREHTSQYLKQNLTNNSFNSLLNSSQSQADSQPSRVFLLTKPSPKTTVLLGNVEQKLNIPCFIFDSINELSECDHLSCDDLFMIDYERFGSAQIELLAKAISKSHPQSKIALFNLISKHNSESIDDLLKCPVIKGIFPPLGDNSMFIEGMSEILTAGYWLPRSIMHQMIERYREPVVRQQSKIKLTKREIQLLHKVSEGKTNPDIASTLNLSEHTVKSHLYNIFKKIEVTNRLQASNWAKQHLYSGSLNRRSTD